jgi:hypothetical protein
MSIHLTDERDFYRPGEMLLATYCPPAKERRPVRALEISVLWFTEGKGEEDLGVHHFERLDFRRDGPIDPNRERRLSVRLPRSPLSYDGVVVKIQWCVRLRVFWSNGKEAVEDVPFRLGAVPAAVEVPK